MSERRERQSVWVAEVEYNVRRDDQHFTIIRRGRQHMTGYGTKSEPLHATVADCVWRDVLRCERSVEFAEAMKIARTLTEAQL